jgi:ankyrin repeat protein
LAEDYNDDSYSDGWFGRCALYFALVQGHQNLVDLLEPITHPEVRELAARAARAEFERRAAEPPPPPPEFRALLDAIVADNPEAVRAALAAGADVNGRGHEGTTPLWLAAAGGRSRALPVLLEHGAEVDAPGMRFMGTPLTVAVRLEREAVLAPLLAAGADPDRPDQSGMTAWQMARINPRDGARLEALRRACEEVRGVERTCAAGRPGGSEGSGGRPGTVSA